MAVVGPESPIAEVGGGLTPEPAKAAETLKVGAFVEDVSPLKSVIMGGYGSYFITKIACRWSKGVNDPLCASVIAFSKGSDSLIIISIDLVGLTTPDIQDIRSAVAAKLSIDPGRVIVCATHTHQGPDTVGLWGTVLPPESGRDESYMAMMKKRAADAAVRAWEALKPAKLSYATLQISDLHFNTYEESTFTRCYC